MFKEINLFDLIKKHRVSVLIGSIIAFIVGALCVISPYALGTIFIWIMVALVGLGGILTIIKFIFPGKGNSRRPFDLAGGIILLLASIAVILVGVLGKDVMFQGTRYTSMEVVTINMLGIGSLIFGVFSAISNLILLCTISHVEHDDRGLVIAKSILGIIVGVLMVVFPFVMFGLNVLIGGIYIMFMSLVTFITAIKFWKSN